MAENTYRMTRRELLGISGAGALALAIPGGSFLSSPALARGSDPVDIFEGRAFGTGWSISLPGGSRATGIREALDGLLNEIDAQMSPWRPDSVISAFNHAPAGTFRMPEETVHVASAALEVARTTGGAFDPSVGPLVSRWGFGPISGDGNARWEMLQTAGDTITKTETGVTLDLCGIAKGRALDRMSALLSDRGYENFLIDLGGELAARGRHPSGRSWHAGIENPVVGMPGIVEAVRLENQAVATSGDRHNGYQAGRRRYGHIIDPQTGEPVESDIASVSVVAGDAMTADAWATALMAAGSAKGPDLAEKSGVAALFLLRAGDGLRRKMTGGFDRHLA